MYVCVCMYDRTDDDDLMCVTEIPYKAKLLDLLWR